MAGSPDVLTGKSAYELWADTYPPSSHNALMRAEYGVVALLIASVRPGRALDAGTGSGRYLPVLSAAGARPVVGLDFSPRMLAHSPGALRVCGDARTLPFADATFDLVNASLMAGDIRDLTGFVRGLARVLTPGGHLIYSDFHPTWKRNGWRRTFRAADGRLIDVPFVPHRIDDHRAAVRGANLELLAAHEPRLPDDGDAEIAKIRQRWGDPPVVVVLHAVKA